jgi:hypothetical protein
MNVVLEDEDYANNYIQETGASNGRFSRNDTRDTRCDGSSVLEKEETIRGNGNTFNLNRAWNPLLIDSDDDDDDDDDDIDEVTGQKQARPATGVLMLGRTESGHDYGLDMDNDNVTLGTDTSSTMPTKMQVIHRSFPASRFRGEEVTVADTKRILGRSLARQASDETADDDSRDEILQSARHYNKFGNQERSLQNEEFPRTYKYKLQTSNDPEEEAAWLEIESHKGSYDGTIVEDESNCFCLGYGMLDFWLPADTAKIQQNRANRRASHGQLPMITVNEEVREEEICSDGDSGSPSVASDPVEKYASSPPPSPRAAEPAGAYHDPSDDYLQHLTRV